MGLLFIRLGMVRLRQSLRHTQQANIQTMSTVKDTARRAFNISPEESALHYPFGDTLPAAGHTLEVATGVRWLRMGLPFALDHINLWLLRDRQDEVEGWTIVDCGIANDATRANWQRIFEHELQGLPVLRVIVTHMHPDHVGLADWLTTHWSTTPGRDCRLWMSSTDWHAARIASGPSTATTGFGGEASAQFFALHGLTDAPALAEVRGRSDYYSSMVPQVPTRYRRLMDGMRIDIGGRAWHCIAGYGHAPEHIALHCPSLAVLISGDMVLPRISTNVAVYDGEPEGNPLPMFLQSITAMKALPATTLVLPSHGKPFIGLHTRVDQLLTHHAARYAEVLAACTGQARSAADMVPVLFKRALDLHQMTFAMGESIAHLHALADDGRMRRVPGSDGVMRFITV
jgi:glyoxylase-like metal-dependent hydrolase (beta-lactamase superfamily II)